MGLVSSCPIGKTYFSRGTLPGSDPFALSDLNYVNGVTLGTNGGFVFDPITPAGHNITFINPSTGTTIWDLSNVDEIRSKWSFTSLASSYTNIFWIDFTGGIQVYPVSRKITVNVRGNIILETTELEPSALTTLESRVIFNGDNTFDMILSVRQLDYSSTLRIGNYPYTFSNNQIGHSSHFNYGPLDFFYLYVIGNNLEDTCKEVDNVWQNGYNGPSVDFFTDPTRAQNQLEATFEVTSEFIQQYQDSSTEGDEVIGTT